MSDLYLSMSDTLEKQKKEIRLFLLLGVSLQILLLALGFFTQFKEKKDSYIKLTSMNQAQFCFEAFKSIKNGKTSEVLFNDEINQFLKESPKAFKGLKEITLIKSDRFGACEVFAKDTQGIRRFELRLSNALSSIYGKKVIKIQEKKMIKRINL